MTPEEASAAIAAAVAAEIGCPTGRSVAPHRGRAIGLPESGRTGDYVSAAVLRSGATTIAPGPGPADRIADRLREHGAVAHVTVTGPGFLTLTLTPAARGAVVAAAAAAGTTYGVGEGLDRRPAASAPSAEERDLGRDAARFARARHGATAVLDRPRWRRAEVDNPAYAVQLAHARTRRILRSSGGPARGAERIEPSALFGLVALWPQTARTATSVGAGTAGGVPDSRALAAHLEAVAAHVEALEPTPGHPLDDATVLLAAGAGAVLGAGLALLGLTAPERM